MTSHYSLDMLCRRLVSGIPRCSRYARYLSDDRVPEQDEYVDEYPSGTVILHR